MRSLLLAALCALPLTCAAAEPVPLTDEIRAMDTKLFDAFNRCDIDTMGKMFSRDLEFFHDLGGLSGYDGTMEATRGNCARHLGLKRTLVEGTLKVYPIKDYGAIEVGEHTFCHVENGKDDCGTFGFTHVWKRVDGGWQLTRVVSYGH